MKRREEGRGKERAEAAEAEAEAEVQAAGRRRVGEVHMAPPRAAQRREMAWLWLWQRQCGDRASEESARRGEERGEEKRRGDRGEERRGEETERDSGFASRRLQRMNAMRCGRIRGDADGESRREGTPPRHDALASHEFVPNTVYLRHAYVLYCPLLFSVYYSFHIAACC